jgi:hypothetical protein
MREAYLVPRSKVFKFPILQGWQLDLNSGIVTSTAINNKTMFFGIMPVKYSTKTYLKENKQPYSITLLLTSKKSLLPKQFLDS